MNVHYQKPMLYLHFKFINAQFHWAAKQRILLSYIKQTTSQFIHILYDSLAGNQELLLSKFFWWARFSAISSSMKLAPGQKHRFGVRSENSSSIFLYVGNKRSSTSLFPIPLERVLYGVPDPHFIKQKMVHYLHTEKLPSPRGSVFNSTSYVL